MFLFKNSPCYLTELHTADYWDENERAANATDCFRETKTDGCASSNPKLFARVKSMVFESAIYLNSSSAIVATRSESSCSRATRFATWCMV